MVVREDTKCVANLAMSDEERRLREELALAYRVCAHEGLNEGCDNHLSAALESQDAMLTLPYGVLWQTTQPDDLLLCDFDGNVLRDSARSKGPTFGNHHYVPDITAIRIHGEIHKGVGLARAKVVLHTHQHYATAMSCMYDEDKCRVQQVCQNSTRYLHSMAYYDDYRGAIDSCEEGQHLAGKLLEQEHGRAILMKHHGLLVIAPTVAAAMEDLYYFEKAAKVQCELVKMGCNPKDCVMLPEEAEKAWEFIEEHRTRTSEGLFNAWKQAGI